LVTAMRKGCGNCGIVNAKVRETYGSIRS